MLEYATSARRPPSAAPRFHSKARDEPLHAIKDIEESRHSPYVTISTSGFLPPCAPFGNPRNVLPPTVIHFLWVFTTTVMSGVHFSNAAQTSLSRTRGMSGGG